MKKLADEIGEILYTCNGTGAGADDVARFVKKRMKEYATRFVERAASMTTAITSEEILKLKKEIKNHNL